MSREHRSNRGQQVAGQENGVAAALSRLLREYQATGGNTGWSLVADSVHRGQAPIAMVLPDSSVRHFHLDHLGTPRLLTASNAERLSYRIYAPFGEPFSSDPTTLSPPDRLRFTGHESDRETSRYYMHARHFGGMGARFSSLDTHPANPNAPQSFNRYAYALGNPMKYVDPNGENPAVAAIWPLVEIGLTAYDVHDTYQVLSDPDASGLRKTVAVGLTAVGLITVGGGYTRLGGRVVEFLRPSSPRLARALEAAGTARRDREVAHHIVAAEAKGAAPARNVLARFGIGVDSADNGVFLPERLHQSMHTDSYYSELNSQLGAATTREEVIEILARVREKWLSFAAAPGAVAR